MGNGGTTFHSGISQPVGSIGLRLTSIFSIPGFSFGLDVIGIQVRKIPSARFLGLFSSSGFQWDAMS